MSFIVKVSVSVNPAAWSIVSFISMGRGTDRAMVSRSVRFAFMLMFKVTHCAMVKIWVRFRTTAIIRDRVRFRVRVIARAMIRVRCIV